MRAARVQTERLRILELKEAIGLAPQDAEHEVAGGGAEQLVIGHDLGIEHVSKQVDDGDDIESQIEADRQCQIAGGIIVREQHVELKAECRNPEEQPDDERCRRPPDRRRRRRRRRNQYEHFLVMAMSNMLIFSIWYWIIDPPGVDGGQQ